MSFSISISGHGPEADVVAKVFETAVKELKANLGDKVEGYVDPSVSGQFSASDAKGGSASGNADDVSVD